MSTLPSHLRDLEADLAVAARRRVGQLRRRRRTLTTLAIVVVLIVSTGAALAASGVGIFGWLAGGRPGEARFSLDTNSIYEGPAPGRLVCADASKPEFTCEASVPAGSGHRVYFSSGRVEALEGPSSRAEWLEAVEKAKRAGSISAGYAEQIKEDLRVVPDDFFEKWNLLQTLQTIGVGWQSRTRDGTRYELLPPSGTVYLAVCEQRGGETFVCRDLAGAHSVPVGAPIYVARPSSDWVETPIPDSNNDNGFQRLIEDIWGRPLQPAERRIFVAASTPGQSTEVTSGASTVG